MRTQTLIASVFSEIKRTLFSQYDVPSVLEVSARVVLAGIGFLVVETVGLLAHELSGMGIRETGYLTNLK